MGEGIWILIWDGWGSGLNMINPRLLTLKDGTNWFPLDKSSDITISRKAKCFEMIEQFIAENHKEQDLTNLEHKIII